MSSIFDTLTQSALNALKYEDIDALLWMITNTGTVNAMDWGTPLNSDDPAQVQSWCETIKAKYNPELSGSKMIKHVRKLNQTTVAKPKQTTVAKPKKPTVAKPKQPTVPELKAQCKAQGIKGFSKMKRAELEHAIANHTEPTEDPEPTEPDEDPEPTTWWPDEDPEPTEPDEDPEDQFEFINTGIDDANNLNARIIDAFQSWPDIDDEHSL